MPGQTYSPDAPWRWFGPRDSTGRLDALDTDKGYRPLVIPLHFRGTFTIQLLVPEVSRRGTPLGPLDLDVRLSSESSYSRLQVPSPHDGKVPLTWKRVELSGQNLVISHPEGGSCALSAVQLVPVENEREQPERTVALAGESLVQAARAANEIYESENAADAGAYFGRLFAQMHSLNLDTVATGNGTAIAEQLAILDSAHRNKLKVLLSEEPLYGPIKSRVDALALSNPDSAEKLIEEQFAPTITAVKDHPALSAYMVYDEPFVEEAPGYRLLSQVLARLDPRHPAIGYLCRASWDTDSTTRRGVDNMKKFVEGTDAPVLLNDLYPVRGEPGDIQQCLDRYVACLDDDVRQAGGRPLWIAAQTYRYGKILRDPTPAEIRVQAMLSIAHGATGVVFYVYNAQDSSLFDKTGHPTEAWHEVGRTSADLTRLRKVLLKLHRVEITGRWPQWLDITAFQDQHGKSWLMVVNKDVASSRESTCKLAFTKLKRVVDEGTGSPVNLTGEPAAFRLTLAPGDGRLLRLEEKP